MKAEESTLCGEPLSEYEVRRLLLDESWHGRWKIGDEHGIFRNTDPIAAATAHTLYEAGYRVVKLDA